MTQKTGALIFDETADRYDIRFDTALCLSTHHFLKRRELKVKIINTGYMVRAPTPCAYRGRKPHPYN